MKVKRQPSERPDEAIVCAALERAADGYRSRAASAYNIEFLYAAPTPHGQTMRAAAHLRAMAKTGLVKRVQTVSGWAWKLTRTGSALAQTVEPPCKRCGVADAIVGVIPERTFSPGHDTFDYCAACLADVLDGFAESDEHHAAYHQREADKARTSAKLLRERAGNLRELIPVVIAA